MTVAPTETTSKEVLLFQRKPKETVLHHAKMSLEDLEWVITQSPAVHRLYLQCLKAEQFGNHTRKLETDLSPKHFNRAKTALQDKGLFEFEPMFELTSSGRSKVVGWKVRNMHGSNLKSYWNLPHDNKTNNLYVVLESPAGETKRLPEKTKRLPEKTKRPNVEPENLAEQSVEISLPPSLPPSLLPSKEEGRGEEEDRDGLTQHPIGGATTDALEENPEPEPEQPDVTAKMFTAEQRAITPTSHIRTTLALYAPVISKGLSSAAAAKPQKEIPWELLLQDG